MHRKFLNWVVALALLATSALAQPLFPVTASDNNGKTKLSWPLIQGEPGETHKYVAIYKRSQDSATYTLLAQFQASSGPLPESWTDPNSSWGSRSIYRVDLEFEQNFGFSTEIAAGLKVTPKHSRGGLLLVVEDGQQVQTSQFVSNLVAEGWSVTVRGWGRSKDSSASGTAVPVFDEEWKNSIKQLKREILNEKAANPSFKAVLFIGHLPIAYSGTVAWDGHNSAGGGAVHEGAWPTDKYFGDLDEYLWTDTATQMNSAFHWNHNIPGDGKFDQNQATTELLVGRIDCANMMGLNEATSLSNYLLKNHNYRRGVKQYPPTHGERYSYIGFPGVREQFVSAFSSGAVPLTPGLPELATTAMKAVSVLALGGAGDISNNFQVWEGFNKCYDNSVGDIILTSGFLSAKQSPFFFLYGSYFGDWNSTNNLTRAPLIGSDGLAVTWGHGPALPLIVNGEPIGEAMNDISPSTGLAPFFVGDPTLSFFPLRPPRNLVVSAFNPVSLNWLSSQDAGTLGQGEGYFVYGSNKPDGPYTLINTTPLTSTTYQPGQTYKFYQVRLCKLITNGSGSFYALSGAAQHQFSLVNPTITAQSTFTFNAVGRPGDPIYVLESSDLVSWVDHPATYLDASGNLTFTIRTTANQRFFKARSTGVSPSIYSRNAVGYFKTVIPANGFSVVANHFQNRVALNTILPGATGLRVEKKDPKTGQIEIATFDSQTQKWSRNSVLLPGESAYVFNTTGQAVTITLSGEVSLSGTAQVGITDVLTDSARVGSPFPISGSLSSIIGNTFPLPGDQVYVRNPANGQWESSIFDDIDMVWAPNISVTVGQGFLYKTAQPRLWSTSKVLWP